MDKYTKPPLTIDQQIQLLKDRNLVIHDEVFARRLHWATIVCALAAPRLFSIAIGAGLFLSRHLAGLVLG